MTFGEVYIEYIRYSREQRQWEKREGYLTRDELERKLFVNKQVECACKLLNKLKRELEIKQELEAARRDWNG